MGIHVSPSFRELIESTFPVVGGGEGERHDVRGRRMRTAERTLPDPLEPRLKAPPKKKLADFELAWAPGKRRLLPLAAIGGGCGA
jgi:hypothetical protein